MARKGFQNIERKLLVEICRKGGKNSHNRHKWSSEEARLAGIKGARTRWGKVKEDTNEETIN